MKQRRKQIEMKMTNVSFKEPPKKKKDKKMLKKVSDWVQTTAGVITAIGVIGAAVVGVATFLINTALSGTNQKIDVIASKMDTLQVESARTQLITLMSNYPNNTSEILKLADKYFNEMNGDFYVTTLFEDWASAHNVDSKTLLLRK